MQHEFIISRKLNKAIAKHHAMKIGMINERLIENLNNSTPNWEHAVNNVADMYDAVMMLDDEVYKNYEEEM